MNKNLYIGNLAMEVTVEDLLANFSNVGKVVSANIIKDKYTGMSKGFGFVEIGSEKEASDAIQRFNQGELYGKAIIVSEARPKKDNPKPQGRSGGFGRKQHSSGRW